MTMILLLAGAAVAVAAATRSTYSPCGLSMMSSITPFGEKGRGHRYWATATWFVVGAAAGGATLGAVSAALAAAVGAFGPGGPWALAAAAALAALGALLDADVFGAVLPLIRRQVDDRWMARYRPWVYGAGFGWQIGVGVATYMMTASVLLVVALGALSGSPLVASALGVVFGLARGCTVFLTSRAADAAALRSLHQRVDAAGAVVRRAVIGVQVGVAGGLAVAAAMGGAGGRPADATWLTAATVLVGAAGGAASAGRRRAVAPGTGAMR